MRWTVEETRIVAAAANIDDAHTALLAAGHDRTKRAVRGRRRTIGIREGAPHSSQRWLGWSIYPRHNQAEARAVAAFIEQRSPMTLAEFEAGMRKLEGRRE